MRELQIQASVIRLWKVLIYLYLDLFSFLQLQTRVSKEALICHFEYAGQIMGFFDPIWPKSAGWAEKLKYKLPSPSLVSILVDFPSQKVWKGWIYTLEWKKAVGGVWGHCGAESVITSICCLGELSQGGCLKILWKRKCIKESIPVQVRGISGLCTGITSQFEGNFWRKHCQRCLWRNERSHEDSSDLQSSAKGVPKIPAQAEEVLCPQCELSHPAPSSMEQQRDELWNETTGETLHPCSAVPLASHPQSCAQATRFWV